MTNDEFQRVKETLREICDKVIADKQPEYTQHSRDVLFNFKLQARQLDLTPKTCLYVHLSKHLASIAEFCAGHYNSEERIDTRIVDAINYLTLLYALHVETALQDTPA